MQITINIPDAVAQRVVNAFAVANGYQPTVPASPPGLPGPSETIPNPETRAQFVRRKLMEHLRTPAVEAETREAGEAAAATKRAQVEAEIVLG